MTDPRGEQLARLIEENPDDIEAFRAYGDWLEEQGDPRSQLMGMQMIRARLTDRTKLDHLDRRLEELFEANREHFLGKALGKLVPKPTASRNARLNAPKIEWRNGFIYKTNITGDGLEALLQHPSGKFLVDLETSWIPTLATHAPRSLRRLRLGGGTANLSALWPRIPHLDELDLYGGAVLGTIDLPALRIAKLDVSSAKSLRELATARLPKVEYLRLRMWPEEAEPYELAAVFARGDLPSLRWLDLGFDIHLAEVLRAIRASPMGAQLTDITLRRRDDDINDALAGMTAAVHPDR